ncbi:MAG TPA: hypothetical protein VL307_04960 [Chitinophagaceae bacterium]|nr:hypothetical protein [Chitinophagaceae bacterium]
MMPRASRVTITEKALLLAGLVAMVIIQCFLVRPPFYDEADYLGNVAFLQKHGFGKTYLVSLQGSAGPLYSLVHYLFTPVTHLAPPFIRLVNSFFLAGTIALLYVRLHTADAAMRWYGLYIMAIPMTYVVAGMALTEMPALFFFTAFITLVLPGKEQTALPLWKAALAGFCLSLAIIGRQPYLTTLAALPLLITTHTKDNRTIFLLTTAFFALLLPCFIFYTWKGLVPPIEGQLYKNLAEQGSSYRIDFFFLCLFYFAIGMLLIAPRFFSINHSKQHRLMYLLAFAFCVVINYQFHLLEVLPLKGLTMQLLSPGSMGQQLLENIVGSIVICSACYFLFCMYRQLPTMHFKREVLFYSMVILLISASCAKITWGFSSRYAAQGLTPLLLLGSYFYQPQRANKVLVIAGVVVGLSALLSYFLA